MAAMMSDCKATARRRGQRGKLRRNSQIEVAAGGGWRLLAASGGVWRRLAAMDVNGDDRRRQAAMATGGNSRGSGSGTFGGSGGRRLRW